MHHWLLARRRRVIAGELAERAFRQCFLGDRQQFAFDDYLITTFVNGQGRVMIQSLLPLLENADGNTLLGLGQQLVQIEDGPFRGR